MEFVSSGGFCAGGFCVGSFPLYDMGEKIPIGGINCVGVCAGGIFCTGVFSIEYIPLYEKGYKLTIGGDPPQLVALLSS